MGRVSVCGDDRAPLDHHRPKVRGRRRKRVRGGPCPAPRRDAQAPAAAHHHSSWGLGTPTLQSNEIGGAPLREQQQRCAPKVAARLSPRPRRQAQNRARKASAAPNWELCSPGPSEERRKVWRFVRRFRRYAALPSTSRGHREQNILGEGRIGLHRKHDVMTMCTTLAIPPTIGRPFGHAEHPLNL